MYTHNSFENTTTNRILTSLLPFRVIYNFVGVSMGMGMCHILFVHHERAEDVRRFLTDFRLGQKFFIRKYNVLEINS